MAYGGRKSKFSYAAMMALGMAYIAQKNHERVEFSVFGDAIIPLKRRGMDVRVQQLVHKLKDIKAGGKTRFDEIMRRYHKRVTSKSLLFIFSDFLYPIESMANLLARYRKSQLFLVQVLHEDEVVLPFHGDFKFVDPEEKKQEMKTYVSQRTKTLYQEALHTHTEEIKDACKGYDVNFLPLDTRLSPIEGFVRLWNVIQ
jgi:uncharacterized protein (DUF58 family)